MDSLAPRTVLLSHALPSEGPRWLRDVGDELRPSGFVFCRAHSGPETIRRVEQGRLAAAILVEDRPYELRDVDGSPVDKRQARRICQEQYHVPDEVRRRNNQRARKARKERQVERRYKRRKKREE